MATFKVQFRRGTTAEHTTFTGAQGEITYDTETNQLVLHDGVTPGGHRIPLITDVPTDLSQLTDDGAALPVQTSIPEFSFRSICKKIDESSWRDFNIS